MIALLFTGPPGPFRSPSPHLSTTSMSGDLGQSGAREEGEIEHKIQGALIGAGTHSLMSHLDSNQPPNLRNVGCLHLLLGGDTQVIAFLHYNLSP